MRVESRNARNVSSIVRFACPGSRVAAATALCAYERRRRRRAQVDHLIVPDLHLGWLDSAAQVPAMAIECE